MFLELVFGRNSRGIKVYEGRVFLVFFGLIFICSFFSRCDCFFWRVGVFRFFCVGRRFFLVNLDLRGYGF